MYVKHINDISTSIDYFQRTSYNTWMNPVNNYSRRRLTYISDKLPTLQGLANKFQKVLANDTCIFGRWTSDLIVGTNISAIEWRLDDWYKNVVKESLDVRDPRILMMTLYMFKKKRGAPGSSVGLVERS